MIGDRLGIHFFSVKQKESKRDVGKLNIILSLGAPRETGGAETHAPSLKSLMQLKKKYDAPDVASLPDGYKQNSDKGPIHVIQFH